MECSDPFEPNNGAEYLTPQPSPPQESRIRPGPSLEDCCRWKYFTVTELSQAKRSLSVLASATSYVRRMARSQED